jgi:hypothetical protein
VGLDLGLDELAESIQFDLQLIQRLEAGQKNMNAAMKQRQEAEKHDHDGRGPGFRSITRRLR